MLVVGLAMLLLTILFESINYFVIDATTRVIVTIIILLVLYSPIWFGLQHLCWRIYNDVPSTIKDMFFVYKNKNALKSCAVVSIVYIAVTKIGVEILLKLIEVNARAVTSVLLVVLLVMLYWVVRLTLFAPFLLSSDTAKNPFGLFKMSLRCSHKKILSSVKIMISPTWWVWLLMFALIFGLNWCLIISSCNITIIQIINNIVSYLMGVVLFPLYLIYTAAYASKFFMYKRRKDNNEK